MEFKIFWALPFISGLSSTLELVQGVYDAMN